MWKNKIEELKKYKTIHGLSSEITDYEIGLLKKNAPIQKIVGFINFDDLQINVNRNVLIPRYETEEVVLEALKYIDKNSKVLDLCAGSGYIGLTIKQKTNCDVTLSDISDEAIIQIQENASLNNLNVQIIKSDMFESINNVYDVIVSNPPYIPNGTNLDRSVIQHEPLNALFGGEDGNDFYRKIFENIPRFLKPGGYLILEISNDNLEFFKKKNCVIKKDINKKERIVVFKNIQP